jgi:predicted Zn-dependent peptidase
VSKAILQAEGRIRPIRADDSAPVAPIIREAKKEIDAVNCNFAIALRAMTGLLLTALLAFAPGASAYLDLAAADLHRLDNGLTLIVLENHELPVVSVQMLYRVGARNEPAGATGLAHFLEHMAFRSSQNFPDTQIVGSIYAAGGEWHGYTWLDQTTYFETAPREQLDLLLRIEADRMARLDLPEADVQAERGAVLAEMHGYENDPASVLHDQVLYLVFLAHPYRNNSIGWESDVAQISHAQLADFYRQHYQPGNAVLAVVGDIDAQQVRNTVQRYFGAIPGRASTPPPHTREPEQRGERRLRLQGDVPRKYFMIAYRAPAVGNPDYAAFLLAQELLAGGSGVSFLQNDWGTPVRAGAALDGISDDLATWFPPSHQDYVFTISGSVPEDGDEQRIEAAVAAAIRSLDQRLSRQDESLAMTLQQAKAAVLRALVFDVQTTEDAAHQLAFFAGLDALDVLDGLPRAVERTSVSDVRRVLQQYLRDDGRSIGWFVPGRAPRRGAVAPDVAAPPTPRQADPGTAPGARPIAKSAGVQAASAAPAPQQVDDTLLLGRLGKGIPVILRRASLSPTVHVKIVTSAAAFPASVPATPNEPVWGTTSMAFELLPDELQAALDRAGAALRAAAPPPQAGLDSDDPAEQLQGCFEEILGLDQVSQGPPGAPMLIVVTGDIVPQRVLALLERNFGDITPASPQADARPGGQRSMLVEAALARPFAQEQLGYAVPAPGPGQPAIAWQMALYILAHGYEGRLGKAAISQRGLVYYIDSAYHSDGRNGWITLATGVDPQKHAATRQLLRAELHKLLRHPPTDAEIAEAGHYLLGRHLSAAQSNAELADSLTRQWLWYGKPISAQQLQQMVGSVGRQQIIDLLPSFTAGAIVSIRNPQR